MAINNSRDKKKCIKKSIVVVGSYGVHFTVDTVDTLVTVKIKIMVKIKIEIKIKIKIKIKIEIKIKIKMRTKKRKSLLHIVQYYD